MDKFSCMDRHCCECSHEKTARIEELEDALRKIRDTDCYVIDVAIEALKKGVK